MNDSAETAPPEPTPQPIPPLNTEPTLVNERTREPETPVELRAALRDSREEAKRLNKINANLLQSVNTARQETEAVKRQVAAGTTQIPQRTGPREGEITGGAQRQPQAPARLAPPDHYIGPSLKEVYLAVVGSLLRNSQPKSDADTKSLGMNALGLSEVFYHLATQRRSFSPAPAPLGEGVLVDEKTPE